MLCYNSMTFLDPHKARFLRSLTLPARQFQEVFYRASPTPFLGPFLAGDGADGVRMTRDAKLALKRLEQRDKVR
jgi:hypothetical protein